MEKEKWKDEVMSSLHGLQQAEPNAFLFTRIEANLEQATGLSKLQVRLAGVCMMLLLTLNIWMASSKSTASNENNMNALTTTYTY
jgi:hypothetical protein